MHLNLIYTTDIYGPQASVCIIRCLNYSSNVFALFNSLWVRLRPWLRVKTRCCTLQTDISLTSHTYIPRADTQYG